MQIKWLRLPGYQKYGDVITDYETKHQFEYKNNKGEQPEYSYYLRLAIWSAY